MRTLYTLHVPYKNGSWRGLEKCYTGTQGTVTLFENKEDAEQALAQVPGVGFKIWPIEVEVPSVRSKRRDDGVNVIETGDRWAVVKNGKFIGSVLKFHGQWSFQSPDGTFWLPETGHLDNRDAAISRLLEEWEE